jgi:metal-responsive CopG/Arc/MetJ family transcriptional regulator
MKVTFSTADEALYRRLKARAAADGRPVRELVEDALREWLERREDREDVEGAREALAEYERDGGVAAAEHFEHLAAELRERYGSSADRPSSQGTDR